MVIQNKDEFCDVINYIIGSLPGLFSYNSEDIPSKWNKELNCSFLSASVIPIQAMNPRQKTHIHQIM